MIQSSCREASTHSSAALSSRIRPQVAVNREKSIRDRVKRVWDTNGSPFGWRSSRKIYGVGAKAHNENARTCQNQPRSTKHSDCTDQGDRPRRRGHYGSGDSATSADQSSLLITSPTRGLGSAHRREFNLLGLVLGCIEAKFCK